MSDNEENSDFEDLDIELDEYEEDEPPKKPIKAKTPSGARVSLVFRSTIGPGEKMEKLTVDPEVPVKELKRTLGSMLGLDPENFHLSVAGRTLDSDDVLSNYDIADDEEVLIIPVSTAGRNKYE